MRIVSVEAFPVRLARDRSGAEGTAGSPTPLHGVPGQQYAWSTSVEALYSVDFETALVRVVCSDGQVGWGEAQAPLAPEVACQIVRSLLKPVMEGMEIEETPEGIGHAWDRMYASMRVRGQTGGFMLDAIAGVDIALWDLLGQRRRLPVAALISEGAAGAVPAYLSGLPQQSTADALRHWTAEGFTSFKLFHGSTEDQLLRNFDEVTAHGVRVAVDALWRMDPDSALKLGASLDQRDALWFEAPLPPEDPIAHGALAAALRTPVAIGESYRTIHELAPFYREKALQVVQPDLGRTGITQGIRIAAQAASHNVPVVPHISIALGPQIAGAVHYAAAMTNCNLLEFNPGVFEVANRYLAEPLRREAASYVVPQGPGLGIQFNRAALATLL